MPKIYLYAEILTHIRQLSLHASLQTAKAEGTKVDVSTDKKVITVVHDGETQKLYLPTQISGTAQVIFPLEKKTEISARVQIDDEHEWKCNISNEIEAPWMAGDLTHRTTIRCRQCAAVVLAPRVIQQWKDLPSENWADLMDFWFCHKPHDDSQSSADDAAQAKGFSSNSKLAVTQGTGMVDLTSLVLHSSDCQNTKVAENERPPETTAATCRQCDFLLGTINQQEDFIRLSKSTISINLAESTTEFESYPASVFVCAQVLSLIESTALKKFVVHSALSSSQLGKEQVGTEALIMWVFNPDIYYSCSAYDGNALTSTSAHGSETAPNPRNDDTSQIYTESDTDVQASQASRASEAGDSAGHSANGSEKLQESKVSHSDLVHKTTNQNNPSHDDTSQVYDATAGLQIVTGDIELEVPITEPRSQVPTEGRSSPVESIADTETPFISAKATSTLDPGLQAEMQPSSQSGKVRTEHINLVHRATKIFYKPLPAGETPASFLENNSTSHEELFLRNPLELTELHVALEKSNQMLPTSAKAFQEWKVGLLDRYEKVPSGLGVMQENPLARGIKVKDGRVTRWSLGNGAEGLYA